MPEDVPPIHDSTPQPPAEETTGKGRDTHYVDRDIKLEFAKDNMRIVLHYPRVPDDVDSLIACVRAELEQKKVPEEFRGPELAARIRGECEQHDPETALEDVVIIEGLPFEPPVDGYIEWAGPYFAPGFVVDEETGKIDWRKRVAQPEVSAGDRLATLVPPVPGKNGRDVYGRMVPAPKGHMPSLQASDGVRYVSEELSFYSLKDGRVRMSGSALSVDEVLVIEEDVGLRTGDIRHRGAVVVQGDVREGSSVKAQGDLVVEGTIEDAEIVTGGDLSVRGGILGGEKKITVAGRVHAQFMRDAHIEAGRDIVVEREILQSRVKTRGALAMQYGRLIGGEVIALRGILAGQTGSEANVPTTVIAGRDFRLLARLDAVRAEIDSLEDRREKIQATLGPVQEHLEKLDEEKRALAEKLLREMQEIDRRVGELGIAMERLRLRSKTAAVPRIEVLRVMYPDTILYLGAVSHHLKREFPGPVHAVLMHEDVDLRYGRTSWNPLRPKKKQDDGGGESHGAAEDGHPG